MVLPLLKKAKWLEEAEFYELERWGEKYWKFRRYDGVKVTQIESWHQEGAADKDQPYLISHTSDPLKRSTQHKIQNKKYKIPEYEKPKY